MAKTTKELLELCGSVESIIYHNEKNQYSVIEVLCEDELVTVVGTFPYVGVGEDLKIYGQWTSHPSFGPQFKAEAFEKTAPKTTAAILKYLSGGAVKGIGPATARRIVETFGENTLDVLENDCERLSQIKGITSKKAKEIGDEFQKVFGIRELMLFLGEFGVKPEEAVRVWKSYGALSQDRIKEDPYCICDEYIMVDFSVADEIAFSMSKPQDNEGRILAGIMYVLKHNTNNGHTCLPMEKLIKATANMLGVGSGMVEEGVITLCGSFTAVCRDFNGVNYIFLPKLYNSEVFIAERLAMMVKYPPMPLKGVEDDIKTIEDNEGIAYASRQREAITEALGKGLLILTGGPGTGKTTTLNAIIRLLKQRGETVFLAAPTGRAAKRMSELTGEEAKTIHRMLQVDWDEHDNPVFTKNEGNSLECDTVVIDELSMVDVAVFEGLLHALPLGCRLILVGDSDQLPSVGAGNIIGDLIGSEIFSVVELKEIFRQSMESLIVTNSHKIVQGIEPELNDKTRDFFFMPYDNATSLTQTIVSLCSKRLPQTYGYSPLSDIQVLCPGRKGEMGTINLNKILRDVINPKENGKKEHTIYGTVFRTGDKVMQIKNDYDLPWDKEDGTMGQGVFNGDMGTITEIDKVSTCVRVKIDDKEVIYDFEKAGSELEHAYAITVHKSQGNEFSAVIMPIYRIPRQLSYRNLLYTGITRAKKLLIIAGTRSEVYKMIENDRKTRRYTGLPYFLKEEFYEKVD